MREDASHTRSRKFAWHSSQSGDVHKEPGHICFEESDNPAYPLKKDATNGRIMIEFISEND